MSLSPGLPKKDSLLRDGTARSTPVCLHMPSVIED